MSKMRVSYPNPADDVSFERLGKDNTRAIQLQREINEKQRELDALVEQCEREARRLKEIGYDLSMLKIVVMAGGKNGGGE